MFRLVQKYISPYKWKCLLGQPFGGARQGTGQTNKQLQGEKLNFSSFKCENLRRVRCAKWRHLCNFFGGLSIYQCSFKHLFLGWKWRHFVSPPLKLLWLIPYKVIISEGVGELGVTVLNEEAVRGGGTVATFPLLPGAYPPPTHPWLLATHPPHLRYGISVQAQFNSRQPLALFL